MKFKKVISKLLLMGMLVGIINNAIIVNAKTNSNSYSGSFLYLKTTISENYTGTSVGNKNTSTRRYCYTSAYTYNAKGKQIDYDNCYGPKTTGAVGAFYYDSTGSCAKVKGYGSIRSTASSTSVLLEKHTTTLSIQ